MKLSTAHWPLLFTLLLVVSIANGQGAGRAFPVASENFVIASFQRINKDIEWDHTNFLVDLSGHYATCKVVRSPLGIINVNRRTLEGTTIVGAVDVITGNNGDAASAEMYIELIIKRWVSSRTVYYTQISQSNCFGCSIRPACSNQAVVACLFANTSTCLQQKDWPQPLTTRRGHRELPTEYTPPRLQATTTRRTIVTTTKPWDGSSDRPHGIQKALAFTPEQYKVAEDLIHKTWDSSHYLENLSGYETDCAMINTKWYFSYTNKHNQVQGRNIKGEYGYALNRGSTPQALEEILRNFKLRGARALGCSVIPDCIEESTRQMYVVVSCLYEE
jgi:hypothetical protein